MGFFSRLEVRSKEIESLLCIGLDPHLDQLTSPTPESVRDFCLAIIEATSDIALAYKPNIAFFEVFGSQGIAALETVIDFIPEQIPIILDAKRGDIASSAQAYAKAIFETYRVDAVTVNPYLGFDAIAPFLEADDKGVFLLCKTSNPGAKDIQDRSVLVQDVKIDTKSIEKIYELIAANAVEWNTKDNLGLVVGATQIDSLRRVRNIAPDMWILAPGIGAQGGELEIALEAGLRSDGFGMIIPASRAISKAPDPRQESINLNEMINQFRKSHELPTKDVQLSNIVDQDRRMLATEILRSGCVKFGEFTLKSGMNSPIYIDLRLVIGYPKLLLSVAEAYSLVLHGLSFDIIAGLPYAGLPIASAISLIGGWSLIYPRKESKAYGTRAEIEGVYSSGQQVVLIDDLATTGGSKFEAIEKLNSAGLRVRDIVVLIDRQSGASETLADSGFHMHSIFTLSQLVKYWLTANLITPEQAVTVEQFIIDTKPVDQ